MIGAGANGALPVRKEAHEQGRRHDVDLVVLPTAQAICVLTKTTEDTKVILHLTC